MSDACLRGEGFALRPWRRGDEAAIVRHANHHEVWRNLTDRFPHPYTRADADDWIGLNEKRKGPTLGFAIVPDDEGEPVGGAGLERLTDLSRRTAETGYWLGPDCWGRGLATRVLRAITLYGFETIGFERIQASVLEWNPASCRVLEKAGYRREARLRSSVSKDGALIDSFLYAALRGEWSDPG